MQPFDKKGGQKLVVRGMGFAALYPSMCGGMYNGYNGVGGKGIDKMIDQWIARHDELPALSD